MNIFESLKNVEPLKKTNKMGRSQTLNEQNKKVEQAHLYYVLEKKRMKNYLKTIFSLNQEKSLSFIK